MKTVILDPTEHRDPSNEDYIVYSLAEKKERFKTLDEFFFATVATNAYPKDERWYQKRIVSPVEISKRLSDSDAEEVRRFASTEVIEAVITVDDVMEIDCHLMSSAGYLRFLCYSTA